MLLHLYYKSGNYGAEPYIVAHNLVAGRHLGRKRQQPWPMANPRRQGERRGGEDIPPERNPVRRRRYAGIEASSCGVLGRR